jgi:hypothetical protein
VAQVLRQGAAVLMLGFAAMAMRRGLQLWHRDRRLPKNLVGVMGPYSRAVTDGLERAMMPLTAAGACLGAVFLAWFAARGGHPTGVPRWLGAIALGGMFVSVCTSFVIVWFNRPRWMVPPFMRSELGMTTAWWPVAASQGRYAQSTLSRCDGQYAASITRTAPEVPLPATTAATSQAAAGVPGQLIG